MVADFAAESHDAPDTIETMNKLMNAVDRLRKERDALRGELGTTQRDFEFFKVESRFTIESLRKKIQNDPSALLPSVQEAHETSCNNHLQRAFNVSILVAQHLQAQQSLDSIHINGLTEELSHSQERFEGFQQQIREKDASNKKIQREDVIMRDALTTAEVKLASAESRVTDLTTLVRRLEEESKQERASREELSLSIMQTEAQLSDVNKALEDAESQRASLALQVSHLQQDLDTTRAELLDAEARYRTLQATQLASMSSSAQTRALKEQITELEGRVLRRTEQIGIHQHDIKRLETNLRLQEERVAEMTAELEIAEAEKKAMVEDCRNTREERDEALKRREKLEEDVEMADESRDMEVQTLVGIVAKAVADRRIVEDQLARFKTDQLSLSQQLHNTAQTRTEALKQAQQIEVDHKATLSLLDETRAQLQSSQESLQEASSEAKQATVALATLYQDLRGTSAALHESEDTRATIEQQFQVVRTELQVKLNELSALRVQYEALRARDTERALELEAAQVTHNARVQELEEQCRELRRAQEDVDAKYQESLRNLEAAQQDVLARASESVERVQEEEALRMQLEEAQSKFETEAAELREQLAITTDELKQARIRQASTESDHRQALEDAENARKELQQGLEEAIEKLETRVKVAGDLEMLHAKYEEEAEVLKERLRSAERELTDLTRTRDENMAEHARALEELEQKREEAEHVLREKEAADAELSAVKLQLQCEVKALEDQVESMERKCEEMKQKYEDLEVRADQAHHGRDEIELQLQQANTNVDLLRLELKSEMEGRAQHADQLAAAKSHAEHAETSCTELKAQLAELQGKLDDAQVTLTVAKEQGDNNVQLQESIHALQHELEETESALRSAQEEANRTGAQHASLNEEVVVLRTKLDEADTAMKALQEEEQRLHMELTPLHAEVQKLRAERRFLENKIQGSESEIAALKKQLEDTHAAQVHWEKSAKSAEVKLDLQVAQHNKVVDSLRKELAALQEATKLADTIADLQERNAEMEELLKAKCQEIEENDDRFIKFLKDEKKLTAKVEFLTKKVKTLQDKLAAVGSQDITPKAVPLLAASSSSNPGPSQPTAAARSPPPTRPIPALPEMPDFSGAVSSSRSRSSIVRSNPVSPEDRIPAPVFRARTPEARQVPTFPTHTQPPEPLQDAFSMSTSSSSTIGIKRRAPEDFDDCDNVPPQPFTAESVPHGDGVNTPRMRRTLQSVRTGFTPVRHVRPAPQEDSPPRRTTTGAPIIADVTNSPRSKSGQAAKKGWLGKIKGGSSSRTSSRPIDKRPQNAAS